MENYDLETFCQTVIADWQDTHYINLILSEKYDQFLYVHMLADYIATLYRQMQTANNPSRHIVKLAYAKTRYESYSLPPRDAKR